MQFLSNCHHAALRRSVGSDFDEMENNFLLRLIYGPFISLYCHHTLYINISIYTYTYIHTYICVYGFTNMSYLYIYFIQYICPQLSVCLCPCHRSGQVLRQPRRRSSSSSSSSSVATLRCATGGAAFKAGIFHGGVFVQSQLVWWHHSTLAIRLTRVRIPEKSFMSIPVSDLRMPFSDLRMRTHTHTHSLTLGGSCPTDASEAP